MIMGRIDVSDLPPICTKTGQIERVHSFKLFGYMLTNPWLGAAISSTSRLRRPKFQTFILIESLKYAGLPNNYLKHFYTAAIRPILEYCSVVWEHNLSKKQSNQLELIQKMAIRVIYRATRQMPYDSLLYCSNITSFEDRRSQRPKKFFTSILDQSPCLHHLIPQQRDNVVTSRLRSAFKFPVPFARTNNFQSFINYGYISRPRLNIVFVSYVLNF